MFSGSEIAAVIEELGFTHVVWLPDSTLGPWEASLDASPSFKLVRVCREGEAWPLAAGLMLGGKRPLVIMQCTGLFESGDALRNAVFDLKLPLVALIGVRSWLLENSTDSAKHFTLPIVEAWGIPYSLIESPADKPKLSAQLAAALAQHSPALVLLAEGRG